MEVVYDFPKPIGRVMTLDAMRFVNREEARKKREAKRAKDTR